MSIPILRKSWQRDLVVAVERSDLERLQLLLSSVDSLDFADPQSGLPLIHVATTTAVPEVVEMLVDTGVSIDAEYCGTTALAHCLHELDECEPGSSRFKSLVATLRVLQRAGADVAAGSPDQRPAWLAQMYGLEYLLENGS